MESDGACMNFDQLADELLAVGEGKGVVGFCVGCVVVFCLGLPSPERQARERQAPEQKTEKMGDESSSAGARPGFQTCGRNADPYHVVSRDEGDDARTGLGERASITHDLMITNRQEKQEGAAHGLRTLCRR